MALETKTRTALEQRGAKRILADFMNVWHPDAQIGAARLTKFREQNGPLLAKGEEKLSGLAELMLRLALRFATAHDVNTMHEADAVNKLLDEILGIRIYIPIFSQAGMPEPPMRPAIRADFLSGKWEPTPRTLLDALAIELMRSRKALHRCERPECQRYFVKEFSRDRYCSNLCSEAMRRTNQKQWAVQHQEEIKRRRRKSHSKSRA